MMPEYAALENVPGSSVSCKKQKTTTKGDNNENCSATTFSASSTSMPSSCPRMGKICESVLDAIGNTPLIRLNHIGADNDVDICVKCEFLNAGGSVKDRIAKRMIEAAEQDSLLIPHQSVLIEPTSGNTGIGIALASAVKQYKCTIVMPEKMSKEKVDVLKALGAEIIRTPTEAAHDAPDSHISVAKRLRDDTPNGHILDQYGNRYNPEAHYITADEIWSQCNGKIDMVVAGVGTGGTITGLAQRLRSYNPNIKVVGVDPAGSILAIPDSMNDPNRLKPYHVEGTGYDFIPDVLKRDLVNDWIKTNDHDSFIMMRRLIREEGLLCGGSSGAAVWAALTAVKSLESGQRCVVILPDSVRNYMTKALSDEWMTQHGFVDKSIPACLPSPSQHKTVYQTWWATKRVYDMQINTPVTITSDIRCSEAIALLKREGFDMVPVLEDGGASVMGVVTEGNITRCILSGRCHPKTTVAESGVIYKSFHKFAMNSPLQDVAHALDHDPFVLIVTEQKCFSGNSNSQQPKTEDTADKGVRRPEFQTRSVVSGIVSRIDLLDFISSGEGGTDDTNDDIPIQPS